MLRRTRPMALEDFLKNDVRLPVCPIVYIRLSKAMEQPDDTNFSLAEILSSDLALTSQILRVSNSAVYGLPRQVRSVDEAVFRIGYGEVWAIASALKAKELFASSDGKWSRFSMFLWDHALKTGVLVRALAKAAKCAEAELLFTSGMLHDVGKSVLHQISPQYSLLCDSGGLYGRELADRELDFFGADHARLGGQLLAYWNLPDTLVRLVLTHHDTPLAGDPLIRLRSLLSLADEMARIAITPDADGKSTFARPLPERILALSGVSEELCLNIAVTAQKQFEVLVSC